MFMLLICVFVCMRFAAAVLRLLLLLLLLLLVLLLLLLLHQLLPFELRVRGLIMISEVFHICCCCCSSSSCCCCCCWSLLQQ